MISDSDVYSPFNLVEIDIPVPDNRRLFEANANNRWENG